jgi:hypothetical protein
MAYFNSLSTALVRALAAVDNHRVQTTTRASHRRNGSGPPGPDNQNFVVASDFSLFQCPLRSAKTANHDLKTLKMLFKIKSAPSRIEKGIS